MSNTPTEILQQYIEKGVDDIIENSKDFIENLKVASGIKKPKMVSVNSNSSRGSLSSINELLEKDGYKIERDSQVWPMYHVTSSNNQETFKIIFKKKVSDLYEIVKTQGLDGLTIYKVQ